MGSLTDIVEGQLVSGWYCDVRLYTHVVVLSASLSSTLVYVLWGFVHNLALVFVFVVLFESIVGSHPSYRHAPSPRLVYRPE